MFAAASIVGVGFDLGVGGLRLPTVHRQVEEEWRTTYRGWVWGVAFGFQLALGVVTVVTTATVYVAWLAAVLSGSVTAGAAIGVAFGLSRALPIFSVAGVRRPAQLLAVGPTLRRLAAPARRATLTAGGVVAVLAAVGAVR
jgi:hypothetical protein